jgi:LAO/AO transport system kinase
MWQELLQRILLGDVKALARGISLVENEQEGYFEFLQSLPASSTKIIGITGPPGAGKSTLTDGLISEIIEQNKRVGVLCVDPSSPFNLGALLGDRIRMSEWYNHPNVFIRSLATRGSLGGLHPKIIEIADLVKTAPFDYLIIETVGVGQSEVEIAGLADTTVVVMVPESGDAIQSMKAGLMEIADIFVVNKADRPGAELFMKNLWSILIPSYGRREVAVLKTVADKREGVKELFGEISALLLEETRERKYFLQSEKAYYLIQRYRMRDVSKEQLKIELQTKQYSNLYQFIQQYFK